ncbi:MAG TPA: zf-HC2 domain-containing protein [Anaerolineae bacterium]|nr:zf-HC2 domain-containing protein [Anaerolineae bacterium]
MSEHCIAPDEIHEGDLAAYLDGSATPEVIAHIERCPACAAEAAALRQVEALFAAALYRADCPPPDQLLEYQAGLLNGKERRAVAQHLKGCAECRQELARLKRAAQEPGEWSLVEQLKQSGKQVLVALLTPAPRPALAFRGGEKRERVYRANGYQIILALTEPVAGERLWQIEGQVMRGGTVTPQGKVCLLKAAERIAGDCVDEMGYFALENVPAGHYALQIEFPDTYIVIENFDLP